MLRGRGRVGRQQTQRAHGVERDPLRFHHHRQRHGRRHARLRPARERRAHPAARTRRTSCRGNRRIGRWTPSSRRIATSRPRTGLTRPNGSASSPASTTTSAATPKSMARLCLVSAPRILTRSSTKAAQRPPGPSATPTSKPYYNIAEGFFFVHGHAGDDPRRTAAHATLSLPRVPHEPYISALIEKLRAQGLHPYPPADGG